MVRKVVNLRVRIPGTDGWYPNVGSIATKVTISKPPTYPVRLPPGFNLKLQ